MPKDKDVLREYISHISKSEQFMDSHLATLDRKGKWQIGDPFFDATSKQLENICEYVIKIMELDIPESRRIIGDNPSIGWNEIHRLRQRLAHWYTDAIDPKFLRQHVFEAGLISGLTEVLREYL